MIILFGCATKYSKKAQEEEVLRQRVMQYMEHNINREFDKSYGFEYPLYRKTVSMVNYIGKSLGYTYRTLEADIVDMNITDDQATVGLNVKSWISLPNIRMRRDDSYSSYMKQRWVKVDGEWYHLPRKFQKGAKPRN